MNRTIEHPQLKTRGLAIVAVVVMGLMFLAYSVEAGDRRVTRITKGEKEIAAVLNAYRSALTARDVESLNKVFREDAIIFENSSVEGTWTEYRDHHLRPEFEHLSGFEVGPSNLEVTREGNTAWAIDHFPFTVVTEKGERIRLNAAVTYVLRRDRTGWKVVHMHWSSRRVRPPKP